MALAGTPHYAHWTPNSLLDEEVRTIFVLGFPPDVKERELQNLLRWWPGYEASQMNFKGEQPMGFALFSSATMALTARDALQNLVFDPETNSVLRAEMAKKNLYVKRGVTGAGVEPTGYDHSKRLRTVGDYSRSPYVPGGAYPGPTSAVSSWVPQSYIPTSIPYDLYGGYGGPRVQPLPPMQTALAPSGYAPVQNNKDNPPCNTLFIGNLRETTSEAELQGLFSGQPGFKQMKVLRQGRSTVCFIEFVDVSAAIAVHNNLQGAILSSSDRGGVRLQYSKNPFGKRKDFMHLADGAPPGVGDADGAVAKPIQAE